MMPLAMLRIRKEVRNAVAAYTTESASVSRHGGWGANQPLRSVNELEPLMYPQQNETTPQAATMPAQTVNSRWLICQIAGASVMYSDMPCRPEPRRSGTTPIPRSPLSGVVPYPCAPFSVHPLFVPSERTGYARHPANLAP